MVECSRQWFIGDEWDYLAHRRLDLHDVFAPHNEHWTSIPVILWRAVLFPLFGVDHYVLYAVPVVGAHLALTHLLWRFVQVLGAAAWPATGTCAVFGVLGAGYENLTWAFQIGFVGSVLFGYLAVAATREAATRAAVSRHHPHALVVIWAFLVLSLACTNIGLPMVVACALVALLEGRARLAVAVVSVPALVFLTWFALIGRTGAPAEPLSLAMLWGLPRYVLTGLASAIQVTAGGVRYAGGAILVALVLWTLTRARVERTAVALALTGIVVYGFTGLGRAQQGSSQAEASRYAYVAVALLLPLATLAISEAARARRGVAALLALAVLPLLAANLVTLHRLSTTRAVQTRADREQVQASAWLAREGLPDTGARPSALTDVSIDELRELVARGELPVGEPDAADIATQAQLLGTTTSPTPRFPDRPTFGTPGAAGGCQLVEPYEYLPLQTGGSGASVRIESPGDTRLLVIFLHGTTPRMTSVGVPEGTSWLNLAPGPDATAYTSGTATSLHYCRA